MEILVIGTEPPCIRCLTTYQRAKEVARQFPGQVNVRKIVFNSEEAAKYGKIGAAVELLKELTHIEPDINNLMNISNEINELSKDEAKNAGLIEDRFKEIDAVLQPGKDKSRKMGYLMTPVLVINGQVKCQDHVPAKEDIQAWTKDEVRRLKK